MPKLEFWCHVCDNKIVDSTNPKTGKFYRVAGHVVTKEQVGDFHLVTFAVCHECKLEDALRVIEN